MIRRHDDTDLDSEQDPPSREQPVGTTDRPTALPAFDPEAFARQSESALVAAEPVPDDRAIEAAFARVGTLASVPWLMVPFSEVRSLPLEPRSAYVLSLVDGISTVEMMVDMCAMPRAEVLRVVLDLVSMGAVQLN